MIKINSYADTVNALMFSYENMSIVDFINVGKTLPVKLIRWLVAHHPDNRRRKILLRITNVTVGHDTVINNGFIVSDDYKPLLTIGARVAISPNVAIICNSSPNNSKLSQLPGFLHKFIKNEPVVIGDDTWIGTGAIVLPGVTIGREVVIGAGSIVVKSVQDGAVVAGNPARIIRSVYGV